MSKNNISLLIVKFLARSANKDDLDRLESSLDKKSVQELFRAFIKLNYVFGMTFDKSDIDETKRILLERIRKDKKQQANRIIYATLKYAAAILVLVSLGYYVNRVNSIEEQELLVPREDVITLRLGNGETKIITGSEDVHVYDAKGNVIGSQKGNSIVYHSVDLLDRPTENTLQVPYGKKFDIVLTDGTKVFLNSGSSLRYPTNFNGADHRRVHLSGEAYFEVAHDAGKPFLVNSQELQVEVLGTQFNVSNYSEDNVTEVVLVEGSVDLSSISRQNGPQSGNVLLKPGFKGAFDKVEGTITTEAVDVSRYTSWINGKEIFVDAPFENIIKKLERQYNVVIVNKNTKISKERFTATIETERETIEQVMSFFNRVYEIEYRLVGNKIIIE